MNQFLHDKVRDKADMGIIDETILSDNFYLQLELLKHKHNPNQFRHRLNLLLTITRKFKNHYASKMEYHKASMFRDKERHIMSEIIKTN